MFRLNKKVFIALLSFGGILTANCVWLNNEPCMTTSTLIDLDPVELNHYQFMTSIDKKCNGSCNAADGLSTAEQSKRRKCWFI